MTHPHPHPRIPTTTMDLLKSITACLCGTSSYTALSNDSEYDHSVDVAADDLVSAMLTAEKPGADLDRQLGFTVRAASWDWQESFAKAVLSKLEVALRTGVEIGLAATEAVGKAVAAVEGFAKEHPVYFTLIALGVLVLLSPWVIEALGFGELGPIEGTFAAAWQRQFAGYVPKGSLFAFFQRLGMIWRRYPKTG
ncbi:hypothetical protein C8Q74DRAFT_726388 [Fomes fomentarius]|nr:hypothetical protein C8Q74DRAFT_726388 [Fomes fomentarius]